MINGVIKGISAQWHLLKPKSTVTPALSRAVRRFGPVKAEGTYLTGSKFMPVISKPLVLLDFPLKSVSFGSVPFD